MFHKLQQAWRDERGGLGFNMLWVMFVLLFLTPFFWDIGSVHYARRFAGTGADAAALAAAQEYVNRLQFMWGHPRQQQFRGRCELGEFTPQQVVARYKMERLNTIAPVSLGYGMAQRYAGSNRADLTAYRSWREYSIHNAAGVPIPVIKVYTETEREVHTAYGPIYGRDFQVPNRAQAVAYLDRSNYTPRPCPYKKVTYDFTFEWKITMDRAR
ncbi:MAG: pilus assembly protein TadG-related protein [Chloroflexaceae bacterium]|jgi:hypothetical protein|nr:pilus assembly protein TadG-related protein [Chloroflexaceae bacterium]